MIPTGDPVAGRVTVMAGSYRARFFGPAAPLGVAATVRVGPAGLTIESEAGSRVWPFEELSQPRAPRRGEPAHLERAGEALIFEDAAILETLRAAAPAAAPSIVRASGSSFGRRLVIAIGTIAVLAFATVRFGIPALAASMARSVPAEWEEAFGGAVLESVAPANARITDPRVLEPVERIVARLAQASPGDPYRYRVVVVDRPDVNALAAPAGRIVVFRGMLAFVRSPEELASVLAHEMEHVRRRHVTEGLFRSASLGVLFALIGGDGGGLEALGLGMARDLSALSFGRKAELEADRGGLDRMIAARLDPRAMTEMLARLPDASKGSPLAAFLSTHPASKERAKRLREMIAGREAVEGTPLVSAEEWEALRAAVGQAPR